MSKISTETGHLVTTMAAIMRMYLLLKAPNMVHLTCCKMTKRGVSNYIMESNDIHQEFINKLLKWVVQKKKKKLAPSSILREAKVAYYARNMFEAGRFILFFVKAT